MTGITETLSVSARCVDRKTWAELTLDGLAPVFESLATALNAANQPPEPTDDPNQGAEAFVGMLMQAIVPVILGTWAGSMIGQLAHHALGQYDLPLPMRGTPM